MREGDVGEWKVESGKLKVESGKLKTESGKWCRGRCLDDPRQGVTECCRVRRLNTRVRRTARLVAMKCKREANETYIVGEGLAPPETYVKMTLICGVNACFRREDQRSSENDGRFIDRKRRIGYKRSCHAVRRQAPYPTKRTFPLQLLYCDRRPAAGAASRSPTILLQRLL
jgi:hypothetical protein